MKNIESDIHEYVNHSCRELDCEGYSPRTESGDGVERDILLFKDELDSCMFK